MFVKKKMNEEQQNELIKSLRENVPTIPPLGVEQQKVKTIDNVIREYNIALIKGEDLADGAVSWNEYKQTCYWTILWILMLCIEDTEIGSSYINISKIESPKSYFACCNAMARRLLCVPPEPGDEKRIKNNVIGIHMVNKEQLYDVKNAMEEQKKLREKKSKSKKKRRVGADEADEAQDDDEDEGEEIVQELIDQEPNLNVAELLAQKSCVFSFVGPRKQRQSDDYLVPIPPNNNNNIFPKVTFTVTPIPHRNNMDQIVGYLIRILQHDVKWNPGEFIYKLIGEAELREKSKGSPHYKEPWAHYMDLAGSNFPAFNMSLNTWLDCVNKSNGEIPSYDKRVLQQGQMDRPDCTTSATHPAQVCSLYRALQRLKDAGGNVSGDFVGKNGAVCWPAHLKTFRYSSDQVFWYNKTYVGLMYQYFPMTFQNIDSIPQEMLQKLKNNCIVSKTDVLKFYQQPLSYKTGNMIIHAGIEADMLYANTIALLPPNCLDLHKRFWNGENVQESTEYQTALKRANQIGMQKLKSIIQLDGNISYLPVSTTVKAAINWFQKYILQHKSLSFTYELLDPSMSLFANYLTTLLLQYHKKGKILLPVLFHKFHGLFTSYRKREKIPYNLNIYGSPADGKSELLNTLKELCIDKTFTIITNITDSADQTDMSVHDEIRGCHELDITYVTKKGAASNPTKVDKKKGAITEGVSVVKTFEFVSVPGVGKLRGSRTVVQAQEYSEVNLCNFKPDPTSALSSRYHNILLVRSNIPFEEWGFNVNPLDKNELIRRFSVNQFLSMMLYKSMALYAIPCRNPFLGLYKDISAQMAEALKSWGVLSTDFASGRCLNIMEQYVTQLVVEKSLLLTFHSSGAAHYQKQDFKLEYLQECAPFLYADCQDILYTWTAHSTEWIAPEIRSVLRAMAKISLNGEEYDTTKSPLWYYFRDINSKLRFKTDRNPNHNREFDGSKNHFVTDLNMFEIKGNLRDVATMIAPETDNPHLKVDMVEQLLQDLSVKPFVPIVNGTRNGYTRSIPADDLKDRHKGVSQPKQGLLQTTYHAIIGEFSKSIQNCLYLPLLQELTDIKEIDYRTLEQAKQILDVFHPNDLLLLNLEPNKQAKNAQELKQVLINLQNRPITDISRENMERIVKSFRAKAVIDPYTDVTGMTYQLARLILYFFDEEMLMENGKAAMSYLKKPIITTTGGFGHFASEQDIAMLNNVPFGTELEKPTPINIVDLSAKNMVRFSPLAIEMFDQQVILSAFKLATMNGYTKPGKMILGWNHLNDSSVVQTVTYTQEAINQAVNEYDQDVPAGGVLRKDGTVFKRREYITPAEKLYLGDVNKQQKVKQGIEIVKNLDTWAATQQHLICGRPLAEHVRDPEWIKTNYNGPVGNFNYPHDILNEKFKQSKDNWDNNCISKRKRSRIVSKITPDIY